MTDTYPDLASWRKAKSWTQQRAADFLGISSGFYNRLERGVFNASPELAKRIAKQTGVSLLALRGVA